MKTYKVNNLLILQAEYFVINKDKGVYFKWGAIRPL